MADLPDPVTADELRSWHMQDVIAHGNRYDRACAERLLNGCVTDATYDALSMDEYLTVVALDKPSLESRVVAAYNARHGGSNG